MELNKSATKRSFKNMRIIRNKKKEFWDPLDNLYNYIPKEESWNIIGRVPHVED